MTGIRISIGRLVVSTIAAAVVLWVVTGCGEESSSQYETVESNVTEQAAGEVVILSDTARAGEDLFNANCAVCHGVRASGTNQGPTLIDRIYHPGHHSDFSFRNAASKGVPQHHWTFGAMPPVATVSADDVETIICYVRELQRANGIFEGDAFATVC